MEELHYIEEMADHWHRRLSPAGEGLWITGELPRHEPHALQQVRSWQSEGIRVLLDLREERSDRELVGDLAPEITYVELGTFDNGERQPDRWFDEGVGIYRWARENDERLLVLSQMGVSRAPSMAFRLLLDDGWGAVDAAGLIRQLRPIASLAYALDAVESAHRFDGRGGSEEGLELTRWLEAHPIDLPSIIRRIHRTAASWGR
jgi:hypothetical protein